MSFWTWLKGTSNITPNSTVTVPDSVGPTFNPGDPDGFEYDENTDPGIALRSVVPSPWDGWPVDWSTPNWSKGVDCLVDTAWACLDLNSSVLSTMPVYKTRGRDVVEPESWMTNPDPQVYTSWAEFAKQLFWDYQMGEAFVLATAYYSTGYPMWMRVLPHGSVKVKGSGNSRRYWLGSVDITADVLHIRYKSTITSAHGIGPLDSAGARLTAAGVLARYVAELVSAPPPYLSLETDQLLNEGHAQQILDQWVESRKTNLGLPAVHDAGLKLNTHQMNPKDMALLELAQFNEARIAVLLGVPPYLVGLPSGNDSMTYSNVSQLFDFHDRASLRPKASTVMAALSNWALPRGEGVELDREEYTRPALPERAAAYVDLAGIGAITGEQVVTLERQLYATSTPVTGFPTLPGGDI